MSYPTPVGALVAGMDLPGIDRFPFLWWASGAHFEFPSSARHLFAKCGSAAEAFFFRPFTLRAGVQFLESSVFAGGVQITPQANVGKHRIDFAVFARGSMLAVEIDGLTFHHRLAEQIEADYLRARRVVAAGYTVVRFTAQEAFRNPEECWRQLDAILAANAQRYDAARMV